MGDTGDDFRAMKEASKERKQSNQDRSTELLISKGVEFEIKNFGNHLIVEGRYCLIDFWPSTGKFIPRNNCSSGRGVFNLLKQCDVVK